jgi:hypothetical protein
LNLFRQSRMAVCAIAAAALVSVAVTTAQTPKAPSSTTAAAQTTEATGQHRGFTNEKLFLKLDDGKEMTFVVDIPGDKERKWQKDFATLSRIAVTYVPGAPEGPPIATSLKKAAEDEKIAFMPLGLEHANVALKREPMIRKSPHETHNPL